MEVIAVLPLVMNKDGSFEGESAARIKTAIDLSSQRKCRVLLTSGWAYRKDTALPLGEAMAMDIKSKLQSTNCTVLFDTNSRDTVGDAFYMRQKLVALNYTKLTVVTSDYHTNRAQLIFRAFFSTQIDLEVIGVSTSLAKDEDTLKHERDSTRAFLETFANVDFAQEDQVIDAIRKRHPYYNGTVYPKIDC